MGRAGRCFHRVLIIDPTDEKALLNWGQVLFIRAKILEFTDTVGASHLYNASLEKFRTALKINWNSYPALLMLTVTLRDMGILREMGSIKRIEILEDTLKLLQVACERYPRDIKFKLLKQECGA